MPSSNLSAIPATFMAPAAHTHSLHKADRHPAVLLGLGWLCASLQASSDPPCPERLPTASSMSKGCPLSILSTCHRCRCGHSWLPGEKRDSSYQTCWDRKVPPPPSQHTSRIKPEGFLVVLVCPSPSMVLGWLCFHLCLIPPTPPILSPPCSVLISHYRAFPFVHCLTSDWKKNFLQQLG